MWCYFEEANLNGNYNNVYNTIVYCCIYILQKIGVIVSMRDKKTSEELRRLVGVEPIIIVIRSGRLRWYDHVMRKNYEDWLKKYMEIRV